MMTSKVHHRRNPADQIEGTMPSAATRHRARSRALQVLFESDVAPRELEEVLERYLSSAGAQEPFREYLRILVEGVRDNLESIDAEIGLAAPQFPVSQLAAVDRNVLRIALYELRFREDVPVRAAINEAVEIAKRYGGDSSQRFVNGVLGNIARGMATSEES